MDLLQTIIGYYHGEARHGFWAAVVGVLLLIGSILLWKWASPLSLLKGLALPMLLFGLLMGIGGGADNLYTKKATPERLALYQKDPIAFLKQEKVKTEKTHRGWHGIRFFWGILGLSGVVLSLLIRTSFWIGAGLGTVAFAVSLSLFEFFSMRFNEDYYHTIQRANKSAFYTNVEVPAANTQQQVKTQQKALEPLVSEQQYAKPASGTLPSQITFFDSLKHMPTSGIHAGFVKDSASFNNPDSIQNLALINEPTKIFQKGKKRKVLDYYNSDLIPIKGVKAKHCWFSKKYTKV